MTILHMETDAVRSIADQQNASLEHVREQMQTVYNVVHNLDWQGPARDQFEAAFANLYFKLFNILDEGAGLAKALHVEVNEWDETASTLSTNASVSVVPQGNGEVLGINVVSEIAPEDQNEDGFWAQAWDLAKVSIGTVTFIANNNPISKAVDLAVGTIDFFAVKFPEAERAFKAWEDYNRSDLSNWDPDVARALEAEAYQSLEELGLAHVKDAFSLLTKELADNDLIRQSIKEFQESAFLATEWFEVLGPQQSE